MRRSRLKKEREQAQQQGVEAGGEAPAANNGPGYHHVEHEDGISTLSLSFT